MTDEHDAVINYTVKELLEKISHDQTEQFAGIREQLAQKADKAQIDAVNRRLDGVDGRVGKLEERERTAEAATVALTSEKDRRNARREWFIGFMVSVGLLCATFLPILVHHA